MLKSELVEKVKTLEEENKKLKAAVSITWGDLSQIVTRIKKEVVEEITSNLELKSDYTSSYSRNQSIELHYGKDYLSSANIHLGF